MKPSSEKRYPHLVINVRLDPETMQFVEFPLFCVKDIDDYYTIMQGDHVDYNMCPVGSYNNIVTIH